MLKPNIGTLNALIRITAGFTLLGWGTAALVKHSRRNYPLFSVMMGALKVAEGITRFCPVVYLYEERQTDDTFDEDVYSPVNPS
ncbi:YgaP family membrane protein [Salipaludibacillus daqingensis]|uniref:YgaP family membrane protein n=1 Tax=Salipaludibacillus daqingensis TaxID=3041001 RepID=UPI00247639CF|nr:DUF2892 domain-containing protein [Salipaludibacillus daqingensis]